MLVTKVDGNTVQFTAGVAVNVVDYICVGKDALTISPAERLLKGSERGGGLLVGVNWMAVADR